MQRLDHSAHRPIRRGGRRLHRPAVLLAVAAVLGSTAACTMPDAQADASRSRDVRLPLEAFFHDMLDQDGDGVVSGAEWRDCGPQCARYDRDGDGVVTWDEFVADPSDVSGAVEMIFHGPEHFATERAALDADGDGKVSWKEFYNPQMAAFAPDHYDPQTATWRDGSTAGPTPAPAPSPAADGLPVGQYSCHYTYMMQIVPVGTLISILPGGRYQYLDGGTGEYAFDPETGSLHWASGPLAGSGVTGEFAVRDDGRPVIRLKLRGAGLNQRGEPTTQTNRCVGPA